jgi:hypothetical protein
MGVAKLGGHIRYFKNNSVKTVALAGKLFKDRLLYHSRGWLSCFPDFTCAHSLASVFLTRSRDARDDTILGIVADAYKRRGIAMASINTLAPDLLVDEGLLVGRSPSRSDRANILFGWQMARQMGGLDIGQSVTIKDQLVLAVEAIEGTDALIARTGLLCPRGRFILVKVAKPNQDMRFDVPTIGPNTVTQMAAAGGHLIVVEAGKTILVQRERTLQLAKELGITIAAYSDQSLEISSTNQLSNQLAG